MIALPIILGLVIGPLFSAFGNNGLVDVDTLILVIPVPIYFWIIVATHAKRMHDLGKSAWWLLVGFIPVVGPIWLMIQLGCLRGTAGPNYYGLDPT